MKREILLKKAWNYIANNDEYANIIIDGKIDNACELIADFIESLINDNLLIEPFDANDKHSTQKMFVEEIDCVGVSLNKFQIIPSNKDGISRSRVFVRTQDEKILGYFKVYDNETIEFVDRTI